MRLYEISDEMRAALAVLGEREGELDDALEARLDAVELAMGEKVDACLSLAAESRAEAAALEAEAKRMMDRARACIRTTDRLRAYVAESMNRAGVRKVVGSRFTTWIQKSPPRLAITGDVPMEWCEEVTTVQVDKAAIRTALERGEPLDFAHMEQGESLRVK